MKKLKKQTSEKKPKVLTSLAQLRNHDLSNKVKVVDGHTRMMGKQKKVMRLSIPGEGLQKFKKQ
jgi:hypothetical protein